MATPISAYLLRWQQVTLDEGGKPTRFTPESVEAWLDTAPTLRLDVDHGDTAGEWTRFEVDEIGLLAHGGIDERTPAGRKAVQDIRSGRLVACSFHGLFTVPGADSRAAAYDVTDLQPVEGGPCSDPADPGAVIVSLDGEHLRAAEPWTQPLTFASIDDALAHLERLTGITADDVQAQRRAQRQQVKDVAGAIERLALRLAKARRAADSAWRDSRSPWRQAGDHDRIRDFDRQAADLDAELRELLCHDDALVADVYHRFRIPAPVTPMARLKALAA